MSYPDQVKVFLSTDPRFSSILLWLFRVCLIVTENLNLLPQTHEVSKCTYAQPVGDSRIVLQFRGVRVLCYVEFLYRLLAVSAAAVCDVAHSFGAFEKIFSAL